MPGARLMGDSMGTWVGRNWQLIGQEGVSATLGVTLGIGLLDEAVEDTGALNLAFAALRAELGRPVELAAGGASLPEAIAEVSTDTSTLLVRGSSEAVAAAWSRLPALFAADIIPADLAPLRNDLLFWPADLLERTGRNAAALAALPGIAAPELHERARSLLPQLNPASGGVRSVFFTSDESLVGTGFPVQQSETGPPPRTHWADGTPYCSTAGRPSGGTDPTEPSPGQTDAPIPTVVLASLLVPRSPTGVAAAQVLARQLAATAARSGDHRTGIHATLTGMGPHYCLSLVGNPVPDDDARRRLQDTFSRTLALVPDTWVDQAAADAAVPSALLERERRVLGLGSTQGIGRAEVLQAVTAATDTLHFPLASRSGDDAGPGATAGNPAPVRGPVKPPRGGRTFTTWTSGRPGPTASTAANRLVIGEKTIFAGVKSSVRAAPAFRQPGIEISRALAVLEDEAGTLSVVDGQLRMVSFNPLLFRRRQALQQLLNTRLAGVPRLTHKSGQNRMEMERWAKRSKVTAISLSSVAAGFGAFIVAMIVLQNTAAPNITGRLEVTDEAELNNGTRITASAFDIVPPNPDSPEYTVTVTVNFCAGRDTNTGNLPPETQRTVSPGDFSMFDEQYSTARLVDSSGQLRPITLQRGQCTAGNLVYKGLQLANPRLGYKNSVGDDVIWYRYGQVPS